MSQSGFSRRTLSDLLVLGTDEEKRSLSGELDNQLDEIYTYLALILGATGGIAGTGLAPGDGKYVLHGAGPIPLTLPEAALHRDMTGADLHWPKDHATVTHPQSGVDPLAVGVPVDVGAANAEGSAIDYCRRDHVHAGFQLLNHETPVGAITGTDGTDGNAVFTIDSGSILITYAPPEIPIVNDWHRIWYWKQGGLVVDTGMLLFKNGVLQLFGTDYDTDVNAGFSSPLFLLGLAA